MGVCEVVATLADAVAVAHRPLHRRHDLMVHVLRSAPVYREAARLDAWEAAYQDAAREREASPVDDLLEAIYEFGRYNMYGQFDGLRTREQFARLRHRFATQGILTPVSPDLSDW